jgi:hypothetical protein
MWQPVIGVTLIVEYALIGYVRIWIIMLVKKEMLNVHLLSVFGICVFGICVFGMCVFGVCVYISIRVVTLTMKHEQVIPT